MSHGKTKDELVNWQQMTSLKNWGAPPDPEETGMDRNVKVDCGWGWLIFGQTYADHERLCTDVCQEDRGERNVAHYLREPHVILSLYPQSLFLDPSHTFRLGLREFDNSRWHEPPGLLFRALEGPEEGRRVNEIYASRNMVPARPLFWEEKRPEGLPHVMVAVDAFHQTIVGVVMGMDHAVAFKDADNGSSLWGLAVDPKTSIRGVGEGLVRALACWFKERHRDFLDLSVMHNNHFAIRLYEKLGFQRVPVYCIKNKNHINEPLFSGPMEGEELSIYSRIIIDEARRRGIGVEVLDQEKEIFTLSFGGRSVLCRESLSELTSAVSMTICDDKALTSRVLLDAGLSVPEQQRVGSSLDNQAFLERFHSVVVKPARGEQGQGVSVDLRTPEEMEVAIRHAETVCKDVLLEHYVTGQDLRIIVIGGEVVAAAVRKPAEVMGDGLLTVRALIEKQSRRRAAATQGESRILLDEPTLRCIEQAGIQLDEILACGHCVQVCKTANLHTGGTIHDVTQELHPALIQVAEWGAAVLNMPVVGFDFLVPSLQEPEYVIIEANERPGLANHEPQPTAERFIDLLFPQTRSHPPIVPENGVEQPVD